MSKTIYHFGVSGGKDSTALLLWACYESSIPLEQIRATFCDTGNESPITLAYVKMLSDFVFPIETIHPPLKFYELAQKKGRFPSTRQRFCTPDLKMKPTQEWLNQFDCEVILHSGVRSRESRERAKMKESSFDLYYAREIRRPLLAWTLSDVWAIHDKYSVPPNPLYAMGMKRVGCFPCVMERKAGVRAIATHFPDRIEFLRSKENRLKPGKTATFFPPGTVPRRFCSIAHKRKDGKIVRINSIDDVVEWSKTVRGGSQYALGTIEEDAFVADDDKTISCPSAIGQCE